LAHPRGFTRCNILIPQNLSFGSLPNLNPLALKMEFLCLFLNYPCPLQSWNRSVDEAISDRPQYNPPQYRWF
jgi:hypothetical protein